MSLYPPVLTTKLFCPRQAHGIVVRERLHEQLDQCREFPLTLISAPPGYGKTVLASSWSRSQTMPVVWLLLENEESRLDRFLTYLLAALDGAQNGAFSATAALLVSAELPPIHQIACVLMNEMATLRDELFVVLDDYQSVDHCSEVQEFMTCLLNCPPPNLHWIILTRRDPPFPLRRLRANSQCLDIRLSDLRFHFGETKAVLEQACRCELSQVATDNVHTTMEGWGAGIRMASLVSGDLPDREVFLRGISGNSQQVQEYMFDEVVAGLEPSTLHYLLYSSLTQRFSAELLNTLVGEDIPTSSRIDGEGFLSFVRSRNMFTISLGANGEWYRYHNLFRELLLQRLGRLVSGEQIGKAIDKAALWFEDNGYVEDAIRELIDHGRCDLAAAVVERHYEAVLDEDQWLTLQSWLKKFPSSQFQQSPALLIAQSAMAVFSLDLYMLDDLTRQLEGHETAGHLTKTETSKLFFFKAVPLFWQGDISGAIKWLERSMVNPLPAGQTKGEQYMYLSVSLTMSGEMENALETLRDAEQVDLGRRNIFATRLWAARSYIHHVSLQPHEALASADQLARLSTSDTTNTHAHGWANYMRALSLFNTGQLEMAQQSIEIALGCRDYIEKRVQVELYLAKGLSCCFQGNNEGVLDAIKGLESWINIAPLHSDVLAYAQSALVRLALLRGDTTFAKAQSAAISPAPGTGTLLFWLDEPALTWAKVQLLCGGEHSPKLVLPLLDTLLAQVTEQHLEIWKVEIGLLGAIAYHRAGQTETAQSFFREAVELAEAKHWVGPFMELSECLAPLAEGLRQQDAHWAFVQQVMLLRSKPLSGIEVDEGADASPYIDRFTNRELDIIELLAARRRNKEIAAALFVSANTVSFHLKNIYKKLDVDGRRQAVVRAIQMGIISSKS